MNTTCPRCDGRILADHEALFCINCGYRNDLNINQYPGKDYQESFTEVIQRAPTHSSQYQANNIGSFQQ